MFAKFQSVLALSAFALSAFVSAAPMPAGPVMNVVFNPMITSPQASNVWATSSVQTITWQTDMIPVEEQNSTGTILLGWVNATSQDEHLNVAQPLATGFQLMLGTINVTVPVVPTRDDYIVVLFGDSGNASPKFTIKNAAPDLSSLFN